MHASRFAISTLVSGTVFAVSLFFVAQGCGPADSPATGSGGSPGSGGASTGSGGGSATGSGGAATTGSGGASTTGSGGASTTGSGGAATTGSGGASSTGSGGGSATGSGGGSGTVAAVCTTQAKGGVCLSPTDVCGKACGPDKKGTKLETCTGGLYVEGTCDFPAADYTCYKLPATVPACPMGTTTTSGMNTCTAAMCSACSGYTDSSGALKVGYCVCSAGKWTCGSTKEWPCMAPGVPTTAGGTGC